MCKNNHDLLRARQFVRTIRNNMGDDPAYFSTLICEFAHQAAECLLRAYLVNHGIKAPKTHDLIKIWEKGIESLGELKQIEAEIRQVNRGSVEWEHCDDCTEDEAMEAYQAIVEIQGFVVDRMDAV